MVTMAMQAEVTTIKDKLENFLNSISEDAEAIYQDKFSKDDLPAASKRKLGRAIRTIKDWDTHGNAKTMTNRLRVLSCSTR